MRRGIFVTTANIFGSLYLSRPNIAFQGRSFTWFRMKMLGAQTKTIRCPFPSRIRFTQDLYMDAFGKLCNKEYILRYHALLVKSKTKIKYHRAHRLPEHLSSSNVSKLLRQNVAFLLIMAPVDVFWFSHKNCTLLSVIPNCSDH